MKTVTALRRLRKLLSKKERWIKDMAFGYRDRKKNLLHRTPDDKPRNCFCLLGGIAQVLKMRSAYDLNEDKTAVVRALGFADDGALTAWNDRRHRKHADVLARIDKAIEKAA